jgi:hypothetical protein
MTPKPLIIKFEVFCNGSFYKAVTNQYVDLTVYGKSEQDLKELIPEALKQAFSKKYSKKIVERVEVEEADTPQTYITSFPLPHICASAR